MNQQLFIDYIKVPSEIRKAESVSLENLLRDYPWCQTAALLYTLKLSQENNIRFSGQLKMTAAFATDRKILKKHLQSISQVTKDPEVHPEKVLQVNETRDQVDIAASDEASITELLNALKNEVNTLIIGGRKTDEKPVIKPLKELVDKLEQFFDQDSQPAVSTDIKPDIKDYDFEHLDSLPDEKNIEKTKNELIDQFIKEEPRISPPEKGEFFDVVDFAKHSLEDREDIVSETLAKVYLKQGNVAKATKIYKKLSLLYPEKSSFFAAQIEKIRKDQTN